jgi:2-hydroxychromene-2-carboxylate isomerase
LPLLRLAWASDAAGRTPNRRAVEAIFHHVWRGEGADANEPGRLAALTQDLAPTQDPASEAVKEALRQATEQALAEGVFGVPTFAVDGRLFWGLDALPMLAAYLQGDPWFDAGGAWDAAAKPRPGVIRRH